MSIIKKILNIISAIVLFIFSLVWIIAGFTSLDIPVLAILLFLFGALFLFCSIIVIKRLKLLKAPQTIEAQDANKEDDAQIIPQVIEAQDENTDKENIQKVKINYKEEVENIIKNISSFEDCKIIHGLPFHAVAFSRSGEVIIAAGKDKGLLKFSINDIKSIKYEMIKEDYNGDKEWFCIFTTNDFDNPIIKIQLSYIDESNAKELFLEINSLFNILKQNK